MNDKFNQSYYQFNRQNVDRIGNLFYSNIIKKNFKFKSYLDFGCGVGFLLKRIEQVKGVKNIFGIETNEFAIKESEKNTKLSKIYKNIDEIHEKLDLVSMLHVVHIMELLKTQDNVAVWLPIQVVVFLITASTVASKQVMW
mgnify:CR=1 FL=1